MRPAASVLLRLRGPANSYCSSAPAPPHAGARKVRKSVPRGACENRCNAAGAVVTEMRRLLVLLGRSSADSDPNTISSSIIIVVGRGGAGVHLV